MKDKIEEIKARFGKLPAWARLEFKKANDTINQLRKHIAILEGASDPDSSGMVQANTGLDDNGNFAYVNLPDFVQIRFNFPSLRDGSPRTYIGLSAGDGCVQVHAHPGIILVNPRAGNSLHLIPENTFERRKLEDS